MAAEENLITKSDLARSREIDFVYRFNDGIKKLTEALGVTRKIPKQAGAALKAYKAQGTLESGVVAEGDIIPLSKYKTVPVNFGEITLKKWRKASSAESIVEKGYEQSVIMTLNQLLNDVQKGIRTDFFTFLAKGTGTASGVGFQDAAAAAWGQLQVKYEDTDFSPVHFINPLDAAKYLGAAPITTQSAFGMTYIDDFLGLGTIIMNTDVTQGTILSTAKENIVLYYIPVNGADLGEVFDFTSDQTGYIGVHEEPTYNRMQVEDTVISGVKLFAERLDGIVKSTITNASQNPGA